MARLFESEVRVLVTGGHGFSGLYLVPLLKARGYQTVLLESDIVVDLRDAKAVEQRVAEICPTHVIHLAGLSHVRHPNASEYYAVNTLGTENLLAALLQVAPKLHLCVLASSANIYGNPVMDPVTEDCPPRPINHYACSKLAMEHIARTWSDRIPILIARPFNYTGVHQSKSFFVPKVVYEFARKASTLTVGNLDVVRDFSDVRTVADIYARLLERGQPGDLLNICSGEGRSLSSIIDILSDEAGYRPRVEMDPLLVRRSELKRLVGSEMRLVERIGPLGHTDFDETLRWMFNRAKSSLQDLRPA